MKRSVGYQLTRWLSTTLTAVVIFGFGSTASAVPPVKMKVASDVQGQFVYDCGDFNILSDNSVLGHEILYFDEDGNATRRNSHRRYTNSVFYNSEDNSKWVAGVGQVENSKLYFVGDPPTWAFAGTSYHVNVPGYGVIWIRTGRIVFDLTTFEVIFEAGPTTVEEFFGDEKDAFCEFLR